MTEDLQSDVNNMTDSLEAGMEWFTYSLNLPPFQRDRDNLCQGLSLEKTMILSISPPLAQPQTVPQARLINTEEPVINSAKKLFQDSWEEWILYGNSSIR